MSDFSSLGLSADLVTKLGELKITVPTAVQSEAIPHLLAGRDALIQSETGSGKTLAYLLPLLEKLQGLPSIGPRACILAPTQELAIQIRDVVLSLKMPTSPGVLALIGGANPARQAEALKKKPTLIVGTPGRILEFIKAKRIKASQIDWLIADEADQLFDSGNRGDTESILKAVTHERQTVFCSATLNPNAEIARWLKADPVIIKPVTQLSVPASLRHLAFVVDARDKVPMIRRLVRSYEPSGAIAFANNTRVIDELVGTLKYHNLAVAGLHAGSKKLERASALQAFRASKLQVLIATDLAARGLDLSHVSLVFNLDLPTDAAHYVHRVGRTARMGQPGIAITLVQQKEAFVLEKIEKALGIKFEYPVFQHGEVREKNQWELAREEAKKVALKNKKKNLGEPKKKPENRPNPNKGK